jgi:hypothetical protein
MVDNPIWEICERVAEVQALLDDHLAGGKQWRRRRRCCRRPNCCGMFVVGYFPPNTPQ